MIFLLTYLLERNTQSNGRKRRPGEKHVPSLSALMSPTLQIVLTGSTGNRKQLTIVLGKCCILNKHSLNWTINKSKRCFTFYSARGLLLILFIFLIHISCYLEINFVFLHQSVAPGGFLTTWRLSSWRCRAVTPINCLTPSRFLCSFPWSSHPITANGVEMKSARRVIWSQDFASSRKPEQLPKTESSHLHYTEFRKFSTQAP